MHCPVHLPQTLERDSHSLYLPGQERGPRSPAREWQTQDLTPKSPGLPSGPVVLGPSPHLPSARPHRRATPRATRRVLGMKVGLPDLLLLCGRRLGPRTGRGGDRK